MFIRKIIVILSVLVVATTYLATPVFASAQNAIVNISKTTTVRKLRWSIAIDAKLQLKKSGSSITATITYAKPASAVATMSVAIYSTAPNGTRKREASSGGKSVSCKAVSGYEYEAVGTLTLTYNGEEEVIYLEDGPILA